MRRSLRRPLLAATAAAALLVFAGCSSAAPEETPGPTAAETTAASDLKGDLVIFAAASLTAAFDEIAADFETANPDVDVQPIRYDGSSTLATQIIEGASVDVFASADEANMTKVTDAGIATATELFATNTLVVAVPDGNPADVESLADLGESGVTVVLCAPEVPCGAASQRLLDAEGVAVNPASLEQNVTAVLTKVEADEADAGLVYATDVIGAKVESFVPDGAADVVNRYPIAALEGAPNPEAAKAFVAFVLSPAGQKVLESYGFGAP